jgi:very-short-patch-repair endonuclease
VPRTKADAVIAAIAARQQGAVARDQLLAAGISRSMIEHRIACGMLIPVYDGVYLLGFGPRSALARPAAAVLACKPRAMLTHASATGLWRLPGADTAEIHVTIVARSRNSFADVRVHSISHLPRTELRRVAGLPVSSPSLTILDMAGILDRDGLLDLVHEARVRPVVTDRELRASLAAHPNRRGARALCRLLDTEGGIRVTRSKGERRALKLMRAHGLEPDESDLLIGPYRLDFYFSRERVAVEYDSRQFHDNERRFAADRRKIAYLAARGIVTVPLTAHDLGAGANRAMADLAATLASRRETD